VQLRLEEGSARVQALIHQETDLVKQELLSTRLTTPAAANAAGQLNASALLDPVVSFWTDQLTVVRSLTLIWMAASHWQKGAILLISCSETIVLPLTLSIVLVCTAASCQACSWRVQSLLVVATEAQQGGL